jgi:hypothetical protein
MLFDRETLPGVSFFDAMSAVKPVGGNYFIFCGTSTQYYWQFGVLLQVCLLFYVFK